MKFSIGYKLPTPDFSTLELVQEYRDSVEEVYFALPGQASGRAPLGLDDEWTPNEARNTLLDELAAIVRLGVRPVLLYNAACYGGRAVSQSLARQIVDETRFLERTISLAGVTTTSPFIARVLKDNGFEGEIRASVNMKLGSPAAMEPLLETFDGFYLQRDRQRNIAYVKSMFDWTHRHGKRLYLLANSGCLRDCPFQTFHDNLVAHEQDVSRQENRSERFPAPCWEYLFRPENRHRILQNTWIRPEDIHYYAPYCDGVKLATRMHDNPRLVLHSYSTGRCVGNLLDLTEPSYGLLLAGEILNGARFPDDWFETTSRCDGQCESCGYCRKTADRAFVPVAGMEMKTTLPADCLSCGKRRNSTGEAASDEE
jgi:hypothetical protein